MGKAGLSVLGRRFCPTGAIPFFFALAFTCVAVFAVGPFDEDAAGKIPDAKVSAQPSAPPVSASDIIARKNAVPNLPWTWFVRERILLEGAKTVHSVADILALLGEASSKAVREKLLLIGMNTPRNFGEVKALCELAAKGETREKILLANLGKMRTEEILESARQVGADAKDRMFRQVLSQTYGLADGSEAGSQISLWVTDPVRAAFLQIQDEEPRFCGLTVSGPTIYVDDSRKFQAMDGFGFALTGGSAQLIRRIPDEARERLLKRIFSSEGDGIGVSFLRLSIGASDLSPRSFSYLDLSLFQKDKDLARFNLFAGDPDVVPLLKEVLAINPSIRIIATPWSAPPWMKTNRNFRGGKLKGEYFATYARYFVKYIQAMRSHGIRIDAITPQNEPLNGSNEPSMVMEAGEQVVFIRDHLGPALRTAGLDDVEIYCWDHNCDKKDYPLAVLGDSGASEFVAGVAWHLYAGDIGALSEVRQAFPKAKMYFTEQWTSRKGKFAGDLRWHVGNVLIGSIRNWSQAVFEWNLAADPSCDPHTWGGCWDCRGAITVSRDNKVPEPFNVSYYIIGHASKFVPPGSVRVSTEQAGNLRNVAFSTPDGKTVLIVLNDSDDPTLFNISCHGKSAPAYLNRGAVGTFIWGE